jgi:hypothetical protein
VDASDRQLWMIESGSAAATVPRWNSLEVVRRDQGSRYPSHHLVIDREAVVVSPRIQVVAAYLRRANRHLSASWIPWLPVAVALYAASSLLPSGWAVNAGLIIAFGLTLRALWRAGHKSVVLAPDGCLVITNPWRTYRLKKNSVEGYTWTRPAWMGRDAAPVIAVVETSDHSRRRQIRIVTLSGAEALDALQALGLKQLARRFHGEAVVSEC